jgi:hypothetical protein
MFQEFILFLRKKIEKAACSQGPVMQFKLMCFLIDSITRNLIGCENTGKFQYKYCSQPFVNNKGLFFYYFILGRTIIISTSLALQLPNIIKYLEMKMETFS